MIHNDRWRESLRRRRERAHDALEQRLAAGRRITVPSIVLQGDANGAAHASDDTPFRHEFVGPCDDRAVMGSIGHNLPQEAPAAFARAVLDVARA